MADGNSCPVVPEVAARMAAVRHRNGLVGVTIILRPEHKPMPPWTREEFKRFDRLLEDIFDRVTDIVGEGDEVRPNLESKHANPKTGACLVIGRVCFIEELLKQPEIAECLDQYALPPETTAKGLD